MSLYTENLQILTNLSKKIDKATANKNDLETLENLKAAFIKQSNAGYYNREKCEILTTIAAAHVEEVREVIAINEAIKATHKEINAERRKEAAALKAANKADFISAYIYAYGATKAEAAKAYKNAGAGYISAVIESQKHDARAAMFED